MQQFQKDISAGNPPSLSKVMDLVRFLQCSNPLEKVFIAYVFRKSFGLLRHDLQPSSEIDYSLPVEEVFTAAAQAMNADEPYQSLSMIEDSETRKTAGKNLPPWVPDWTIPVLTDRLNTLDNDFCASKVQLEKPPESTVEYLYLKGYVIDRISQISALLPPRRPYDKFEISGANNIIFTEWYEWAEARSGNSYSLPGQR